MRVESVNAGRAELMKIGARTISTGIRKAPVERGYVGLLGLVGDVVVDVENHGGPDQAVYVYSAEDYAWWGNELGTAPAPGTLLTSGCLRERWPSRASSLLKSSRTLRPNGFRHSPCRHSRGKDRARPRPWTRSRRLRRRSRPPMCDQAR
jgi:hypothetical protein